ncbi:hypothetical protein Belba_1638 [Belliella baltica DSM 15883]|uniref:Secreted protein n=3 Tax=Belliella TaxID=232244 RepID=I3Z4S6_BELBD|nr:hypothetical protein Belba_1638 [Belliella baltica DSM 15883]
MKKLKSSLMLAFLVGSAFMFSNPFLTAQSVDPLPGNHICCPTGNGCVDRQGYEFKYDESRVASTCTVAEPEIH